MATAADDYSAVSTADAAVATAQGNVTSAQAALAAANAALTTAQAADTAADQQLAADLTAGPGFITNADGSITVLAVAPGTPTGFSSTVVQPLASIPSVSPTPTTPTPSTPPPAPSSGS